MKFYFQILEIAYSLILLNIIAYFRCLFKISFLNFSFKALSMMHMSDASDLSLLQFLEEDIFTVA